MPLLKRSNLRWVIVLVGVLLLYMGSLIAAARFLHTSRSPNVPERIKSACKLLTYAGISITTGLSVYSLSRKTVAEPEVASRVKKFTPEGKRYLKALIFSALLTIGVSYIENQADDVLSKRHEKQFQEELVRRFGPSLEKLQIATDEAIAKEKQKIEFGFRELEQDVQGATKDLQVQQSRLVTSTGNLMTRIEHSSRDQKAANMEVRSMIIELYLPNVTQSHERNREKTQERIARWFDHEIGEKCGKETPSVDSTDQIKQLSFCINLQKAYVDWKRTFGLFSYFDPKNNMTIRINFELANFLGVITRFAPQDDAPGGNTSIYFDSLNRGLESSISRTPRDTNVSAFGKSEPTLEDDNPKPGLSLEFTENNAAFDNTLPLGRETDLMTFSVTLCPDTVDSPSKLHEHLTSILAGQVWAADVLITSPRSSNFSKTYLLKPARQSFDYPCLTMFYDVY